MPCLSEDDGRQQQLRALEKQQAALLEALDAILQKRDFCDLAGIIFRSVRDLVGAMAGYVALLSPDGNYNEVVYLETGGQPCRVAPELPMPLRGFREVCCRAQRPVYCNDFMASEFVRYLPPGHVTIDNVLFAPLVIQERAVGLLGLANKPGGFTDDDVAVAAAFGKAAALALYLWRTLDQLAESEGRYRLLAENARDIIYRVRLWPDLAFEYVSPAATAVTGYTPEEHYADPELGLRLVYPEDRPILEQMRRGHVPTEPVVLRWVRRDGSLVWTEQLNTPVYDAAGRVIALEGVARDITERKRAEEELRRQKEFLARLLETLDALVVVLDPEGRICEFNRACERLTGYARTEVLGRKVWDFLLLPEEAEAVKGVFRNLLQGRFPNQHENYWVAKNGNRILVAWSNTVLLDEHGRVAYVVGTGRDVTEQRRLEQRLSYLATHDQLTGLPNRVFLEETLRRAISRARRGVRSAVLFLDLDSFKVVNDTYGHPVGDRLLVALAEMLSGLVRAEDLVVRWGGDEFVVLLEDTTPEEARTVAGRIASAVAEAPFRVDDREFAISVSIGLAAVEGDAAPEQVLARADAAMYRAKAQGPGRVAVYRPGEEFEGLPAPHQTLARLKRAMEEGRLRLYLQPVVDLASGRTEHYEALLRLVDEEGNVVSPHPFLGAAEKFGQMGRLTRWVVEEALRTLREYPGIRIFVNLSGTCLGDEELLEFVAQGLRRYGVEPSRLGFEITETAVIRDLAVAGNWIRRLKALGCPFALDDFGVGFNSFAYLRNLPVDFLKINGSYVRELPEAPLQRALVRALHSLAQVLGMSTVAEQVEDAATEEILKEMGIPYAQGYHFARPRPKEAVLRAG